MSACVAENEEACIHTTRHPTPRHPATRHDHHQFPFLPPTSLTTLTVHGPGAGTGGERKGWVPLYYAAGSGVHQSHTRLRDNAIVTREVLRPPRKLWGICPAQVSRRESRQKRIWITKTSTWMIAPLCFQTLSLVVSVLCLQRNSSTGQEFKETLEICWCNWIT